MDIEVLMDEGHNIALFEEHNIDIERDDQKNSDFTQRCDCGKSISTPISFRYFIKNNIKYEQCIIMCMKKFGGCGRFLVCIDECVTESCPTCGDSQLFRPSEIKEMQQEKDDMIKRAFYAGMRKILSVTGIHLLHSTGEVFQWGEEYLKEINNV